MNRVERQEERIEIFERDGWRCRWCGRSVYRVDAPQLAHIIADTKANRLKYGNEVIDHPDNRASTCCLYCNGRMNIGNQPLPAEEHANRIREKISEGK